jgi:hypothetical protein
MIKDESVDKIVKQWKLLTPAQKSALKSKAKRMRLEGLQKPFVNPGVDAFRKYIQSIVDDVSKGCMEKNDAHPAIEIAIWEELQSPFVKAWEHAYQHLERALQDDVVKANPVVVLMLENDLTTAHDACGFTAASDLDWDIRHAAATQAISSRASDAAKSKNIGARTWLILEWSNRTDKDQKKASFARQYAPLVKKKYGVIVTPEQIAREWLPKATQSRIK